jgi:glycine cleavage system regulatory protein
MDQLEHLVLTAIGDDRPGLVEQLAELVAQHGGNWLGSRMAHLAGRFAGIVEIEVPPGRSTALRAALASLASRGLQVTAHRGGKPEAPGTGERAVIEIVGADRPGLVRAISRVLASHGVNVEELDTARESAPMSGEMLFRLRTAVSLPGGFAPETLRTELERLADDLMIELSFSKP